MRLRVCALLMLAVAGFVYVGVTGPTRRAIESGIAEHARLRAQRREQRGEWARLNAQASWRSRAEALLGQHRGDETGDTVAGVRSAVLRRMAAYPASQVRLQVTPVRGPWSAQVDLSARGTQSQMLALLGELSGPDSGLALEQVVLRDAGDASVTLDFVARRLEDPP